MHNDHLDSPVHQYIIILLNYVIDHIVTKLLTIYPTPLDILISHSFVSIECRGFGHSLACTCTILVST